MTADGPPSLRHRCRPRSRDIPSRCPGDDRSARNLGSRRRRVHRRRPAAPLPRQHRDRATRRRSSRLRGDGGVPRGADGLAARLGDRVLTPVASHHMTVIEGVFDRTRTPARWPSDLALDTPLEAVTAGWAERLADFGAGRDPFRLAVENVRFTETAFGRALRGGGASGREPAARSGEPARRTPEDRPPPRSRELCVPSDARILDRPPRSPDHRDRARRTRRGDPRRLPELLLETAEFCRFDDMFEFPPVLRPEGRR